MMFWLMMVMGKYTQVKVLHTQDKHTQSSTATL